MQQYDYDRIAEIYDEVELREGRSPRSTAFLDKILQRHNVSSVLDLTCGTGAQSIGLADLGYQVTACDLSNKMLDIAKKKAADLENIEFHQADMRQPYPGRYGAAITMFNAIGHLSPEELELMLKRLYERLDDDGLVIFDIFNLDYMLSGKFVDHKFIDRAVEFGDYIFVRFNHNRLDPDTGVMEVRQEVNFQEGMGPPEIWNLKWDLQLYRASKLEEILQTSGFKVVEIYGGDNRPFVTEDSIVIYTVAQKI